MLLHIVIIHSTTTVVVVLHMFLLAISTRVELTLLSSVLCHHYLQLLDMFSLLPHEVLSVVPDLLEYRVTPPCSQSGITSFHPINPINPFKRIV